MQNNLHIVSKEVVEVCHKLYIKGYVAATDGNVSARLADGRIVCTPTGRNKGDLKQEDLIVLDAEGKVLQGRSRPSTEIAMHLAFYKARQDIVSVVHAHAPYCTGFATTGQGLTGCVLPEIVVSLGSVPLAPYATPSTQDVPDSIQPYLENHDVILLQNHGVVAAGKTPMEAYYTLEKTEHAAHILFISRMLGGEQKLSASQVEQLRNVAGSSYGIDQKRIPSCETACETALSGTKSAPERNLEVSDTILRAINELGL